MPIIYPNFMSPEEYFKNISGVQKKYESRGPSKRPRSADFLNNVLCVPHVTS